MEQRCGYAVPSFSTIVPQVDIATFAQQLFPVLAEFAEKMETMCCAAASRRDYLADAADMKRVLERA